MNENNNCLRIFLFGMFGVLLILLVSCTSCLNHSNTTSYTQTTSSYNYDYNSPKRVSKYTPDISKNIKRKASEKLPRYTVLFKNVQLGTGLYFGDVLITSCSRKTPKEEREKIFLAIMEKENLSIAYFYRTNAAYKANNSASYSNAYPNAMKRGYLGSVDNGTFQAAEELYP